MRKRRIRFWVYGHEWTRLTLHEGQALKWVVDGYTYYTWVWYKGKNTIYRRITVYDLVISHSDDELPLSESWLDGTWYKSYRVPEGIFVPQWQEVGYVQRDHAAEAMNY